jgi:hypothetical protein
MDILRLIVIVVIFSGIVVVLLYLKSAKSGRKTKRKYMQATNPYDSSGKEEIKAKNDEDFEDTTESEVKIDTKPEAGIKDIKAEFATIIEGLISKIEEREKEVVNKVENIIDTKVQEALSKINDRIDEVLQAQKNSTALVLEKMINSLRQKEKPVDIKSSRRSKKVVGKKVGNKEVVAKVPEKTKEEDLEIPSEVKEDIKTEEEKPIASSEVIEKNVLELDEADSADFDIQEFLEELGNLPSEKDSEAEK